MIAHRGRALTFCAVLFLVLAILSFRGPLVAPNSAQAPRPILFSHADSTRAIAVDSVANTREPFSATSPVSFTTDRSTRLMLFAGNLRLQDGEIIAQAVSAAASINKPVTVAVTDREGNVLGVFAMTGAPATMQIRGGGPLQTPDPMTGLVPVGLEGTRLPSKLGAISKAGTASLF